MMRAFQGSLLDLSDDVAPGPLGSSVRRTQLARGAWIDVRPGWVSGADALLGRLADAVPWRAERRQMYDRMVDVPRLVCFYEADSALPDPALGEFRKALNAHYAAELGEQFVTAACATTGTAATASRGTVTPSGAARPPTRWSRSCRSARRGHCCCARAAAARRSAMTWVTATCS